MSNRRNNQFTWNPHNKLTILDCNFVVDPANGNGLGIRSLKQGGRIGQVFMNSTAEFTGTVANTLNTITGIASGTANLFVGMPIQGTDIPAGTFIQSIVSSSALTMTQAATGTHTGSITYQAVGSPNPAAGIILVQMQDNYNTYLGGFAGFVSPLSGTAILVTTGVTAGVAYVIASLGTTSAAQWALLGVPANITPAVGVAFVAPLTTTATGSGVIESTVSAGIDHIEVIGNTDLSNSNGAIVLGQAGGVQVVSACYASTVLTAPVSQTVVGMTFHFNDSAQGV
jgi:hypothetical protein